MERFFSSLEKEAQMALEWRSSFQDWSKTNERKIDKMKHCAGLKIECGHSETFALLHTGLTFEHNFRLRLILL